MTENYPNSFYRGISEQYYKDGYLLPESFHIDTDTGRSDGYNEISITWNDEVDSFKAIASQLNERTRVIQFQAGIAEIQKKEFEERMRPQLMLKNMSYERAPLENNKYHGNILLKDSLDKTMRTMIKSQLALLAQARIHRNPYAEDAGNMSKTIC